MKLTSQPPIDKVTCLKLLGLRPKTDPVAFSYLYDCLDCRLPDGWQTCLDKKNRVYFVNHQLRQTLWEHPVSSGLKYLRANLTKLDLASPGISASVKLAIKNLLHDFDKDTKDWTRGTCEDGSQMFVNKKTHRMQSQDPCDKNLLDFQVFGLNLLLRPEYISKLLAYKTKIPAHSVSEASDTVDHLLFTNTDMNHMKPFCLDAQVGPSEPQWCCDAKVGNENAPKDAGIGNDSTRCVRYSCDVMVGSPECYYQDVMVGTVDSLYTDAIVGSLNREYMDSMVGSASAHYMDAMVGSALAHYVDAMVGSASDNVGSVDCNHEDYTNKYSDASVGCVEIIHTDVYIGDGRVGTADTSTTMTETNFVDIGTCTRMELLRVISLDNIRVAPIHGADKITWVERIKGHDTATQTRRIEIPIFSSHVPHIDGTTLETPPVTSHLATPLREGKRNHVKKSLSMYGSMHVKQETPPTRRYLLLRVMDKARARSKVNA